MKLTTGILFLGMVAGTAWGQNPDVIENTRNTMKAVQQKKAMDSDAALSASQGSAANPATPSAKPADGGQAGGQQAGKQARSAEGQELGWAQESAAQAGDRGREPEETCGHEIRQPKQVNLAGRRDPFVSPVVNRSMLGSGCSSGKRCLTIDQINLKGVVKADTGMIAVVVNTVNKAYFLRENDPVFNGYVVKITGDSIIFKETVQDRLGKSFTREVTKKITTSAV